MTLRHLQIFSMVCRLESVTRAAEELNMAQPAVSHAIRELEGYYQVKLFERMNRRLYITDAGERLLQYSDSILSQADEARVVLRDLDAVAQIRVGANMSYGIGGLTNLLAGFYKEHSDIPVYTTVQNSSQIEEKILKNNLDFGIMDMPFHSELLVGKLIGWDKVVALCGTDLAVSEEMRAVEETVSVSDLLRFPLLLREPGSGLRRQVDDLLAREHVRPRIVMESVSILSLIEMCERGFGILFLPELAAAPYVAQGRLRKIDVPDEELKREYFLVYHRAKFHTKSMRKFQEYVMKIMSEKVDCNTMHFSV